MRSPGVDGPPQSCRTGEPSQEPIKVWIVTRQWLRRRRDMLTASARCQVALTPPSHPLHKSAILDLRTAKSLLRTDSPPPPTAGYRSARWPGPVQPPERQSEGEPRGMLTVEDLRRLRRCMCENAARFLRLTSDCGARSNVLMVEWALAHAGRRQMR